jgi:Ribonucleotide reductase, alpha subunit
MAMRIVPQERTTLRRVFQETGLPEDLWAPILQEAWESGVEALDPPQALEALLLSITARIWEEPLYERAAAALMRRRILLEALGTEDPDYTDYTAAFPAYIREGVRRGALHPDLLTYDLDRLARALDPRRDALLPYVGLATLFDRYLVRDPETRQVLELPQFMWMRVAMGLAVPQRIIICFTPKGETNDRLLPASTTRGS